MREIKFRAWDGDKNEMHIPEYSDKEDFHILPDGTIVETHEHGYERHELTSRRPDTWILMQYTGLKDKNGNEIYEGDVIYVDEYYEKRNGIIVPDLERTGFKIKWITETEFNEYIHVRVDSIQIIGNIHTNPELLNP